MGDNTIIPTPNHQTDEAYAEYLKILALVAKYLAATSAVQNEADADATDAADEEEGNTNDKGGDENELIEIEEDDDEEDWEDVEDDEMEIDEQ